MPTFKHPCPYCGKFIDRISAACPYCGAAEPFAPKRCPSCRKIVEDPAWIACPSCGKSLLAPPPGTPATGSGAGAQPSPAAVASTPPPAPSPAVSVATPPESSTTAVKCAGCGAPLAAGVRFCQVCGTLVG